jgi:O-antigen ligase
MLAPVVALAGVTYVAVFWNNTGVLGTPVRAIKAVIAPSQASLRDQSSNAYRVLENVNTLVTIRQAPLTGVGFGRKFIIAVAMPDISFFEWWEYITHNSVLWVWMKTGVFGFLALLTLIGTSIVTGLRALQRMPTGDLRAIVCAGVLYLVMHYVYAYVDMSWDIQSMVLVGTTLGLLSAVERIVAQPVPLPSKRWPWQTEPTPTPGLL